MTDYLASAQRAQRTVCDLLGQRGLRPPERWLLAERNALTWLIGSLPTLPSLAPYVTADMTHSLSTALGGKPVIVSNTTGLRYAVLLSPRPSLPDGAIFPEGGYQRDEFPIGVGYWGAVTLPANVWQHVLIGGASGSGKSTFERGLAHTARRHGWQLYLADPDGHTFNPDLWHGATERPVAQSPEELLEVLSMLGAELSRRAALYQELARRGTVVEDVDEYNRRSAAPLRRMLLAIDEANSYLGQRQIETRLADLARRGRKWGLHLALAGHNWRANDVPRELSGLLRTRVCFQVVDNTSGEVVLGSRRWGQAAMRLNRAGRAVLAVLNRVQLVQTYLVRREDEMAWLREPGAAAISPLTELEGRLVRYALERLAGKFIVNRLAEGFAGEVSQYQVRTLAEEWERRGWLTAPAHATDARRVTMELAVLAGAQAGQGAQGEQAAQGRPGGEQGAQGGAQGAQATQDADKSS